MKTKQALILIATLSLLVPPDFLHARGRGGGGMSRGGGGMSRGGGGMSRSVGGGSRPSYGGGSFNRPSVSRPTQSFNRPSPSYSRPSSPSFNRSPSYSRPTQPVRSGSSFGSSPMNRSNPISRPAGTNPLSGNRTPGNLSFPSSSGARIGDRQIGSVDRTPGNRVGDRQIGAIDRTTGRVGDRQIGSVDRTPGNRVGDRQLGAVDRTPGGRVGDGQLGAVDRTQRDLASRAAIPGLAAAGGAAVGSRLSGDMQSQLSARRSQVQQNRESGAFQDRAQSRFENRDDMVASRREQMQSRMDNRPDNIEDRREYRDGSREDRQDYRDNAREDWQDWAGNDPWDDHWDHDHWHDNFGDYWDHMWDEHPVWSAFRVTAWGVNRAGYLFGYDNYYNPYPVEPYYVGETAIDYSEPLVSYAPMEQYVPMDAYVVSEGQPVEEVVPEVSSKAVASFDSARAEFKGGNYELALKSVDEAIGELPKDAALHEFRSLVLFALGRYRESAAAIHAVLAVGPGMNWTTMSGLYGDAADYTKQLRALEQHVRSNKDATDARFLVSYHYIALGHNDSAIKQLTAVVTADPKDTVAADLLRMLGGKVPSAASTPPPQTPAGPKPTEADLLGSWKSSREDGSSFELTLSKEGAFKWAYAKGSDEQEIKGVFIVEDGVLAMEPDSGGVMLADVSKPENGQFTFQQNGTGGERMVFQKQ